MANNSRDTILSLEDTDLDRRTFMQIAAVIGAPAVAGCIGDDDVEPVEGGTLVTSLEGEIDNLDPAYTSLSVVFAVTSQVCQSLTRFDDELNVVPELAEDIEVLEGGSRLIADIREGVQFHPPHQRELVADDIVVNFERRLDPEAGTVWQDVIEPITSVEAPDDYTVEFEIDPPNVVQDANFARSSGSFIVSPEALEEGDGDVRSHPVGTGPFVFEEWIPGDRVRLSAFDDYWEDNKPFVDEVIFREFEEPSVMNTELQNRDLHIWRDVPGAFVEGLEAADGIEIQTAPAQSVRLLMLNTTEVDNGGRAEGLPTSHIEIRHAISEALDREAMVELIADGFGVPAQQHYTEGTRWFVDHEPYSMEADIDRALELIDEAGFDTPVEIEIMSTTGDATLRDLGRIAEDQLSDAGFDPNLEEVEIGTWAERMFGREYDITPNFQGALTIPDGLRIWYYGGAPGTDHFQDDRVDELFNLAQESVEEDQRIEYYQELQEILIDELPNCFLYHPEWVHAHLDSVEGYDLRVDRTQMLLQDVSLLE